MSISGLILLIAVLGALGGVANALMSDNGFALPRREASGGATILRPGFLGNIFLGALSAVIFWGLYGPFAEVNIVGDDPRTNEAVAGATREDEDEDYGETLAGLIGALVIGAGGARVITSEVDKKLLRAAATEVAGKNPNEGVAQTISSGSPAEALRAATHLKES